MAGSTRPAPAATVSAAWRSGSSSGDRAAATPPWAQAEEQASVRGAGVSTRARRGAAASAAERPARPAPRISTPSKVSRSMLFISAMGRLQSFEARLDQLARRLAEAAEQDKLDLASPGDHVADRAHGDLRRAAGGEAIGSGGDGGEGEAADAVVHGHVQRALVAGGQQLFLALVAAGPNRPHRMDHVT